MVVIGRHGRLRPDMGKQLGSDPFVFGQYVIGAP
jgi:hypothetical protein